MSTALLLIDIQNDYFSNGKMELTNTLEAANNAGKILERFRAYHQYVFHIQHISLNRDAGFFLPGTEGVKIHQSVLPLDGEEVIIKHTPNGFLGTELFSKLEENKIKKLVICGMMTHMCIDSTVRAAKELGFEITLIEDACTTKDLVYRDQVISAQQVHYAFISALNGKFATIKTTAELLMS